MNDDRLTQLLRDAAPYADRPLDLAGADLALLDELVSTPDADLRDKVQRRHDRGLGRRLMTAGIAAAAVTALIAVPTVISNHDAKDPAGTPIAGPSPSDPSPSTAAPTVTTPIRYAAAVVRVARQNPRVLVTAPGWKVRSVEGFDPEAGEMTFQLGPDQWRDATYADGVSSHFNAAPQFTVTWYPRAQYEMYRSDRATEPGLQHVQLLGQRGQMISYSATDHAVILPPQGKVFLELRGSVGDEAAFKKFLAEYIVQVGVREWLAAMPASVVTADNEGSAAAAILADIPVPPGFDRGALGSAVALDPYQFGAKVAGAVACGWLDEWTRASRAGDDAAKQRAVEAMATSHHWKVLGDMDVEGDYPEVVWEYADDIAAGRTPEGYREGLGCADR